MNNNQNEQNRRKLKKGKVSFLEKKGTDISQNENLMNS